MTPFYVGKGRYGRGWDRTKSDCRNEHWINTARKHGVYVEIFRSNMGEDEAISMEISKIAELKSLGCKLVNQTNGGDGRSGMVMSPEHLAAVKRAASKRVNCSNGMVFESGVEAAKWLRTAGFPSASNTSICDAANGKNNMAFGLTWWRDGCQPKSVEEAIMKVKYYKGREIFTKCGKSFKTMGLAVLWLRENGWPKAHYSNIWKCCMGGCDTAYGYAWFYKEVDSQKMVEARKTKPRPGHRIKDNQGNEFPSLRQAAIFLMKNEGIKADHKAIAEAAKTGRTKYGRKWKVTEKVKEIRDGPF